MHTLPPGPAIGMIAARGVVVVCVLCQRSAVHPVRGLRGVYFRSTLCLTKLWGPLGSPEQVAAYGIMCAWHRSSSSRR